MFTVSDIIHLIQYYYKSSTYEGAAADVETLRLESLRGMILIELPVSIMACNCTQKSKRNLALSHRQCFENIPLQLCTPLPSCSYRRMLAEFHYSTMTPKPVMK